MTQRAISAQYSRIGEVKLLGNLAVEHYELPNGLQAAIVVDRTTPIFSYQTWFKTGSADEPAGRQGLAHLFEHMMFRKTSRRAMGEFEQLVNANGGTGMNAYTSRDQTVYFFTFPKEKVDLATELESDRMANLVIDSAMFETEKGAVLTERNRGLDDPYRFLWEEVYKLAYTKHNYKYSTIGEAETIKNFTVEEALDFYRAFYTPNNALVIVVGDVRPDAVMASIAERYGALKSSEPKKRDGVSEPFQTEERVATVAHPKARAEMIAKVWHIPDIKHPDYPVLAVIARLLTSGKSALLNERLLNKAKVTAVASEAYISKDEGTFEFFAQLANGESFDEAEEIFLQSVKELAEGKISDDQIQIVKNNVQRGIYHAATAPSALGKLLGDGFINAGDLSFQIKVLDRIDKVMREDISRAVVGYILNGKATTLRLVPELQKN
ncbi:MAG: insulinase family protein [Bacteroidota bacterium]|nr:insulinase family protein [Bacteroidota bacterium]